MFAVFRSLHMKLMLILLLLITSLMAVVGAFLTTSVSSFYIDTFYEQISAVFSDDSDGYVSTLRARAAEPDGAAGIKEMSNELGANLADRVLDAAEIGDGLRTDLQEELDDLREVLAARRSELQNGLEGVRDALDEAKDSLAQHRFQLQMDQAEWLEKREEDLRELWARLDEARQSRIFGQRRLLRAFPGMRSTVHQPALERLRRRLERRGN